MFDKYLIVDDSLRLTPDGFSFDARLGYYRGLGLSMVEDLAVTIDGAEVNRAAIQFDEGPGPIALDDMRTAYDRRWGFGAVARILVAWPERLGPDRHKITLTEKLRISYLPFPAINNDEKHLTLITS